MKFSYGIVAIMAPALVLSAPVGQKRSSQSETEAVGAVLPPSSEYLETTWELPKMGHGPVVVRENLTVSNETDMTPSEVINTPGPVIWTDELPEVSLAGNRSEKEEKQSEGDAHDRRSSLRKAPLRIPMTEEDWEKLWYYLTIREPGKITSKDFQGLTMEELVKARQEAWEEYMRTRGGHKDNATGTE